MVAGMLPLTAVLLAGCGGGDDQAKVEASPQHYLVSLGPEAGPFPIGAGPPRVKENGCKDRHVKKKEVLTRNAGLIFAKALAVWACVVKVGTHIAMPVTVAVDDNTEVVAAFPGRLLKEVKPK
jgi:hypothetical protein